METGPGVVFVEDALKWLGIVAWTTYLVRASASAVIATSRRHVDEHPDAVAVGLQLTSGSSILDPRREVSLADRPTVRCLGGHPARLAHSVGGETFGQSQGAPCRPKGRVLSMNVPLWAWMAVLAVILVMLAIDLFAHRTAHVVSVRREAAVWSSVWVTLGVAFGVVLWAVYGGDIAAQYFAGYVLEKSLAGRQRVRVGVILGVLRGAPRYQHRVLFCGMLGALVLRGVFIAAGSALIASFEWIVYVFGAFLCSPAQAGASLHRARRSGSAHHATRSAGSCRCHEYDGRGSSSAARAADARLATPLLAVLVLVEATDVIFAVDSIPAIFAVTHDPFIVFSSNAFAILGLRVLYFLLADVHRTASST